MELVRDFDFSNSKWNSDFGNSNFLSGAAISELPEMVIWINLNEYLSEPVQ